MNIEKTKYFPYDGRQLNVDDLPVQIRKLIETYDAMREEHRKVAIQYDMASTAVNVKHLQIIEVIKNYLTPPPEVEATADGA